MQPFNLNRFKPKGKEAKDTGFSNLAGNQGSRILDEKGKFNVIRTGTKPWNRISLIHELITISWARFLMVILMVFLLLNLIFGFAYFAIGNDQLAGKVSQTPWENFWECFFFSTQTITTIGYGRVNPVGFAGSVIAALEGLIGLLGFAIASGLMYGRFARPVAKIKFSQNALITPYKDGFGLMFRMANTKTNDLSDIEAQVFASMLVFDGNRFNRLFYELPLERKMVTALSLSWTVVHPIDENSPLFNLNPASCEEVELEILVNVKGFDPTFSQYVMTRYSYPFFKLVWNARFIPAFMRSEDGAKSILMLDKLGDFEILKSEENNLTSQ